MLSLFPEILFLSPLSATLIRIAVAAVFAYCAWGHLKKDGFSRVLAAGELVVAAGVFAGAWTQPASLLGALIASMWLFLPATRLVALGTALLVLVMTLSLLVTGPGALAFDLPL